MSLGGAPSAPAAPDPAATSAAQTKSNKETALYNFGLNNPNYNTPLGSLSYKVDNVTPTYDNQGYQDALAAWKAAQSNYTDSGKDGNGANAGPMPTLEQFITNAGGNPQVTADVKLSPDQQTLLDNQSKQSINLSNLANELQGRVGTSLEQPLPSSNDINDISRNASDAYYKNRTQYLDPQFSDEEKQLEASLANQGIAMGSEAYNTAKRQEALKKQSAYSDASNNAIMYGPQNAQQLFALTAQQRSQPLNELNALRTGSQVSMPNVPGQTPTTVANTDVSGNINNAYAQNLGAYNAKQAGANSMMSGLFSLGGSALGAAGPLYTAFSDRRLKTNIERIGETKGGVPVYRYKYIGSDHVHMGVMADEVSHIPGAVIRMKNGWDAVDYSRLR